MIKQYSVIKDNKVSLALIVVILSLGFYYLNSHEKGTLVLLLNQHRTPVFDVFFVWVTKMGEPFWCVAVALVLIIKKRKEGALLAIALILNTVLVQFLKRMVFSDHKRPLHYMAEELNLIEGIDIHSGFSFPSGHTTGGFTLYFMLSLLIKSVPLKIVLILLGALVGISRVYLSQHFLEDVIAATGLSTMTCLIYYIIFNKTKFKFI